MGLLSYLLKPKVIHSPRLGLLNLIGKDVQPLVSEDKAILEVFFSSVKLSENIPPVCDTLIMYAKIEQNGKIKGSESSFREIIMQSRASIVIVATENEGKNYIEATRRTGYGQANFVVTLKRNGKAFTNFFSQIFQQMHEGISMPKAWVKLAPQGGKVTYENCPDAMLTCELGQIIFTNKKRSE